MTPVRRVLLSVSVFLSALACAAMIIPASAGVAAASTVQHQVSHSGPDIGPWPCCRGSESDAAPTTW